MKNYLPASLGIIYLMMGGIPCFAEAVNKNLISCPDTNGGYLYHCAVAQNFELASSQVYESDFYISYSLTCNRGTRTNPFPSKIEIHLGSDVVHNLDFNSSVKRVKIGTGVGPLTLVDAFPQEMYNRPYGECSLVFSGISVEPSASTQRIFDEAHSLMSEISTEIEYKESLLIKYQAGLIATVGQKENFSCMIDVYDNPLADQSLIGELKDQYAALYHEVYEKGKYSCPPKVTLEDELKKCPDHPELVFCVYNQVYGQTKEWFKQKMNECESYVGRLATGELKSRLVQLKQSLEESLNKATAGISK